MSNKASDKSKIYHTDSIVITPQSNSKDNNEFESTSNTLRINTGDQIGLNLCAINCGVKENDFVIDIPSSIKPSITFSIYDVDYQSTDKREYVSGSARANATFETYACYNDVTVVTLTRIDVHIVNYVEPDFNNSKGGSFLMNSNQTKDKDTVFEVEVIYIDPDGNTQFAKLHGSNAVLITHPVPGGHPINSWESNQDYIQVRSATPINFMLGTMKIIGYNGKWPTKAVAPVLGADVPGNPFASKPSDFVVKNNQFRYDPATDIKWTASGTSGIQLDLQTTSVDLPNGRYDPKGLAIYLTQLFGNAQGLKDYTGGNATLVPNNPFIQRTDDARNGDLILRQVDFDSATNTIVFDDTNTYVYKDGAGNAIPYFIGASEFALQYGSAGEVFSLNYSHMPVFNNDEPGKQNIAIYWTGSIATSDLTYHLVTRSSGIIIHELEPQSFWKDKLGIYDQLITPLRTDSNGVKYYYKDDMKFTEGFVGLGDFIFPKPYHDANADPRKMDPIPPNVANPGDPQRVLVDATGQTKALIGNSIFEDPQVAGGYYLIEIEGLPPRQGGVWGYDENQKPFYTGYVIAVVSKVNQSGGVVIGRASDGIPYVYEGPPCFINRLKVRILNEKRELAEGLGPNNSLVLDIYRSSTD